MFETLFADPRLIEKHRGASLLEERLRYLAYWKESGATHRTLRDIAHYLACLCQLVDLHQHAQVSLNSVVEAVDNWSILGGRCKPQLASDANRKRFIGHACRWLRSIGKLEELQVVRHAHDAQVAAYEAWMKNENGWSEENIRGRRYLANSFCDWLDERGIYLATISIADIDEFMTRYRLAGTYSRVTIQSYARRLRTFIRYAEMQGLCAQGLAEGIIPSRTFHGDTIPPRLTRNDVLKLLSTAEGEAIVDIRDRAILMFLITYGLRANEVAGLRLNDINWEEELVSVRCVKPGRTHLYPLSHGVGQAVLRYLREIRPPCKERELFLRIKAPIRPLSLISIGYIVRSRLTRLGINCKKMGPHSLRHAAAQHLLDEGMSMKEIGDYLGHRSLSSTSVYAKANLHSLRTVANVNLEGLA